MAIAGYSTIGGSTDFNGTDQAGVGGPFTVGVGATITAFHIYLSNVGAGASASIRPLIYQDNAGEPGALIATLTEITLISADTTFSWRDVTSLSVASPSAAIWLGFWSNNSAHRYVYDTPGGNPSRFDSSYKVYSSSAPGVDPWDVAGDITDTQLRSIYVDYLAAPSQVLMPHGIAAGAAG
jgi:hypothetical protein